MMLPVLSVQTSVRRTYTIVPCTYPTRQDVLREDEVVVLEKTVCLQTADQNHHKLHTIICICTQCIGWHPTDKRRVGRKEANHVMLGLSMDGFLRLWACFLVCSLVCLRRAWVAQLLLNLSCAVFKTVISICWKLFLTEKGATSSQ